MLVTLAEMVTGWPKMEARALRVDAPLAPNVGVSVPPPLTVVRVTVKNSEASVASASTVAMAMVAVSSVPMGTCTEPEAAET